MDDLERLPSRRIPAGDVRCPDELVRGIRATGLDCDVIWSCDESTFFVLERDSSHDVKVNGVMLYGWRIALRYQNWSTKETYPLRWPDGRTIVDYVRERDTAQYGETEQQKYDRFLKASDVNEADLAFLADDEKRRQRIDLLRPFATMSGKRKMLWANRYFAERRKQIQLEAQHCAALGIVGGYA